jgi:hypothetical protein
VDIFLVDQLGLASHLWVPGWRPERHVRRRVDLMGIAYRLEVFAMLTTVGADQNPVLTRYRNS